MRIQGHMTLAVFPEFDEEMSRALSKANKELEPLLKESYLRKLLSTDFLTPLAHSVYCLDSSRKVSMLQPGSKYAKGFVSNTNISVGCPEHIITRNFDFDPEMKEQQIYKQIKYMFQAILKYENRILTFGLDSAIADCPVISDKKQLKDHLVSDLTKSIICNKYLNHKLNDSFTEYNLCPLNNGIKQTMVYSIPSSELTGIMPIRSDWVLTGGYDPETEKSCIIAKSKFGCMFHNMQNIKRVKAII